MIKINNPRKSLILGIIYYYGFVYPGILLSLTGLLLILITSYFKENIFNSFFILLCLIFFVIIGLVYRNNLYNNFIIYDNKMMIKKHIIPYIYFKTHYYSKYKIKKIIIVNFNRILIISDEGSIYLKFNMDDLQYLKDFSKNHFKIVEVLDLGKKNI